MSIDSTASNSAQLLDDSQAFPPPNNANISSQNPMNFRCPYCPKKFCTEIEAQEHMGPCLVSRPYPCSYGKCSRRFKSAQNLDQHARIHANLRQYQCQFCEKAFIQKSHLQHHERTHTGEPARACRYCGEGFTNNVAKTQHEQSNCGMRELVAFNAEWGANNNNATVGTSAALVTQRHKSDAPVTQRHKRNVNRERSPLHRPNDTDHPVKREAEDGGPIHPLVIVKPLPQHYDPTPAVPRRFSLDHPTLKFSAPTMIYPQQQLEHVVDNNNLLVGSSGQDNNNYTAQIDTNNEQKNAPFV